MKQVLLTGASGFLGGNFCRFLSADYEITATYFLNPFSFPHIRTSKVDLADEVQIKYLFGDYFPGVVVHLAASSDPNFCELNPELAYKNNIIVTQHLAHICAARKIPLIFASTDLVFDGENAPYSEDDEPHPVNIYGQQKAEAEQIVLSTNPQQNIVMRLPLLYGNSYNNGKSFLQPVLQKLQNREDIFLFTDEFRTVCSAESICSAIKILIEKQINGIYHLSGDERLSRFKMAEMVCNIYGFDKKYLQPSLQKDVKMPAARPKDVSLQNDKMKRLGWQPGLFKDELIKLHAESIF